MENKVKVWIARDKDGKLYAYSVRPNKMVTYRWVDMGINSFELDCTKFPSVKWEDDEPTEAYITLANVPQEKKEIDWEQRRYEIAKELIASFATKENLIDFIRQEERYADFAIHVADTLIKELKTYPK